MNANGRSTFTRFIKINNDSKPGSGEEDKEVRLMLMMISCADSAPYGPSENTAVRASLTLDPNLTIF